MKHTRVWLRVCVLLTSILATSTTTPATPPNPATRYIGRLFDTDLQFASAAAPIVDLAYGRYQGYYDSKFRLNVFKGYAATAETGFRNVMRKSIDTDFVASGMLLLRLASCVGKHLRPRHRLKIDPSSKP